MIWVSLAIRFAFLCIPDPGRVRIADSRQSEKGQKNRTVGFLLSDLAPIIESFETQVTARLGKDYVGRW